MNFMVRIILGIAFIYLGIGVHAQTPSGKISREEYIQLYKDVAVQEMNAYHIPASITLAQGILESGNGNSSLARKANNHFGIKCHKGWNGKTFHMDDDEKDECFRKYSSPYESFKDHSIFLTTRDRYAFLFSLELSDYKGWSNGLKQAGYATNPNYPKLLIKLIEEHQLYNYDQYYKGGILVAKDNTERKTNASVDDFTAIEIGAAGREIFSNNGLKFIHAKKGDTFYSIAQDFNIYTWQVYRYNELKKKSIVYEGQILYLEKKKNKANSPVHRVQPGETLYDISQLYGVKLKKLCKYNSLAADATLFPDQQIKLKQ